MTVESIPLIHHIVVRLVLQHCISKPHTETDNQSKYLLLVFSTNGALSIVVKRAGYLVTILRHFQLPSFFYMLFQNRKRLWELIMQPDLSQSIDDDRMHCLVHLS